MRLRLLKANPKKCSACGADSYRVIEPDYREKTFFGLQLLEASPDKPELTRYLGGSMTGVAYCCGKCSHLDFYLNRFGTEDVPP